MSLLASVIAFLEKTQTVPSDQVDAEHLFKHLVEADAVVDQRVNTWDTETIQKIVSLLCAWLRAHEAGFKDCLCLRLIFKLLSKLLGREQVIDEIAVNKGCISSCTVVLAANREDAPMIKCCLEVLATLSTVESSDTIVQKAGSVALIVDIMRQHKGNPNILEDASTTLAVMAIRTRHRKALSQCQGMAVLVDLLKRYVNVSSLLVAACRLIINFAVKDETRSAVHQSGGVEALMAAFDNPSQVRGDQTSITDVRATTATAIWTCATDCPVVQNMLLVSGWLSSLAAVLQANPDHAGLHEAAMGIIRQVSKKAEYREDIVHLNFVPTTTHAMRTFPKNQVLLKEACGVLGNLAADDAIRVQLGEWGAVDEVVAVLANCRTHEDRKVAKLALGSLANLSNCEMNRNILARLDAVATLLAVNRFYMQNEMILEFALSVLSHVVLHDECNKQLIQAGGIEAMLLFLEEHREDLPVVSRALVTLRRVVKHHLAKSEEAATPLLVQISRAGNPDGCHGITLILEAMKSNSYDETVVKEAALLFLSLSRVPANVPAILSLVVKPCMKVLEVHKNDTATSDALSALLAALPLEEDDKWDQTPAGVGGGFSPMSGGGTPLNFGDMPKGGGYGGGELPQRQMNFAMS